MRYQLRRLLKWACVAAAACAAQGAEAQAPATGSGQAYASKAIRFIVPWSAGSGTDLMSRAFAQELAKAAGQQVVVDNRGGAGATIGTELAAKSPADGYVIYVGGSVSMVISPVIYPKVAYDPIKDFTPVSLVSQFYNAAAVHPSVPVKTVKELIALARGLGIS